MPAPKEPPKIDIPGMGAIGSLKFGPGVIGRTAPIPIAVCVVMLAAIWAVSANPWMVLGLVAALLVFVGGYIGAVLWYGHQHPETALLEGASAVAYKKLQMEQAAKEPNTIDGVSRPVPNSAPPQAITGAAK